MLPDRAAQWILQAEGGYVEDQGGPTNLGITQETLDRVRQRHPHALPYSVRELTETEALSIYESEYWNPVRAGDLPDDVALTVFDAAVNMGPRVGVCFLQQAVNATRCRGERIAVDGIVGPITLGAVRDLCSIVGAYAVALLVLALRYDYYTELARQERFRDVHRGWCNRLAALRWAITPTE